MKYCFVTLLFMVCFSALVGQTKKNQWLLELDAGYSFPQSGQVVIKDMSVVNDSIRSYTTENSRKDSDDKGLIMDAKFIYKKKSGWHYILGLQMFFGNEKDYLSLSVNEADESIRQYGGYPVWYTNYFQLQQNYITTKIGIGYETTNLKSAQFFGNINLLFGGGWATKLTGSGPEVYDYKYYKWTYGNTMLSTFGLNLDIGTVLPINKKWSVVVKGGASIVFMNSSNIKGEGSYDSYYAPNRTTYEFNWPDGVQSNSVTGFLNIAMSAGIRYSL